MRKLIAGIVIGVVLTAATTATAATLGGYRLMAPEVKCSGGKSVVCYSNNRENLYGRDYSVFFSRCSVAVWRSTPSGEQQTVYERWQPYCA